MDGGSTFLATINGRLFGPGLAGILSTKDKA